MPNTRVVEAHNNLIYLVMSMWDGRCIKLEREREREREIEKERERERERERESE